MGCRVFGNPGTSSPLARVLSLSEDSAGAESAYRIPTYTVKGELSVAIF